MQGPSPTPRLLNQKLWGVAQHLYFNNLSRWFWYTSKFENHCVTWTAWRPIGLGPSERGGKSQGVRSPVGHCEDVGYCVKWEAFGRFWAVEWCDLIDIFNRLFWLLCWDRAIRGQRPKQRGKLRVCWNNTAGQRWGWLGSGWGSNRGCSET